MSTELCELCSDVRASGGTLGVMVAVGPAPLTGDGREQPDNVWFVGSANDYGLPLMDALDALYDTPAAATAASSEEET